MSNKNFRIQEELSEQVLQKISALIYHRAGIVLTSQKRDMVYNRLSRRLRDLRLTSFTHYVKMLESDQHSDEWQPFINALTTNLTSFFRESYHFPLLAKHAQARAANYTVWCTAASTGEEACSIAMTLDETLGRSMGGPRVLATDIDTEVLQKANNGVYRLSDLGNLSPEQKKNYFLRGTGAQENLVKVRPELLSSIQYQQLNLLDLNWDVPAPFDAIFCRNVMIYFDQKTQEKLMLRFAKMLKPGGLLFAGHSEHFNNMNGPFRLRGQSVYYLAQEKL
ncbi:MULTISPECIES: CheR family methyltransferase [Yersinia]|uniref:CheR family methyltransferase n=1 Tax=Yersinia TaxID=629 RepID=UPI0005E5DE63|nr:MULTISPECIES: CheR family methyltransferase [Yersinia]RXA94454.1 chemotaxis protein-glutamate O-methyltransferase [Yersinia sp. 2105 StPb PI]CNI14227.1 chemotaxis methyltransferase CheR [Yersinia frederiksenii]CNK70434.1 chemotaxis methyltransferase CheR [Yersinia frederiksenii]